MDSSKQDHDHHDRDGHDDHDDNNNQIENGSCPPPQSKSPQTAVGYGLKKWRRIPRNLAKENPSPASAADSGKALKRVLPPNANPAKAHHHSSDNFFPDVLSSSVLAATAATDSENSEDRSSKSSTAASAPKPASSSSHIRGDKNKVKPVAAAAKATGNSSQRVSQGKGKKARGDRVRFEKENSQSSIESDSRSSNLFFMSGANATSNGNGNGTGKQSASYDGENSDDATASEQDAQTGDDKENAGDVDGSQDGSAAEVSWSVKEAKSENSKFETVRDPLVESILNLQSVQEELVKEVQKLGEIGNEPILTLEKLMESGTIPADSVKAGIQDQKPCSPSGSDKTAETDESSLRATILSLQQTVKVLESKLDEATTLIVEKESKVAELEASIGNSTKSPKEDSGSTVELQRNNDFVDIADELEAVFKQRIEAEIEYLTITSATESLKIVAGKQVKLFEELESVAEGQAEMLNKLGETETKAAKLKKEAQELENYRNDILETEQVLASQRRVYKVTWCFCTQLILLLFVAWIFVSQLSPDRRAVVPT